MKAFVKRGNPPTFLVRMGAAEIAAHVAMLEDAIDVLERNKAKLGKVFPKDQVALLGYLTQYRHTLLHPEEVQE